VQLSTNKQLEGWIKKVAHLIRALANLLLSVKNISNVLESSPKLVVFTVGIFFLSKPTINKRKDAQKWFIFLHLINKGKTVKDKK
jgi:hypothetical protein